MQENLNISIRSVKVRPDSGQYLIPLPPPWVRRNQVKRVTIIYNDDLVVIKPAKPDEETVKQARKLIENT